MYSCTSFRIPLWANIKTRAFISLWSKRRGTSLLGTLFTLRIHVFRGREVDIDGKGEALADPDEGESKSPG